MKIKDFWIKLFVIFFAFITPFIMMFFGGIQHSLSYYWFTIMQPIFILSNAMVSHFMFFIKEWRIPGVFLLLLTAFPMNNIFHNYFAVSFFLTSGYSLFSSNRFKIYSYLYTLSIVGFLHSILIAEIIAITVIVGYQLHNLLYAEKLLDKNKL